MRRLLAGTGCLLALHLAGCPEKFGTIERRSPTLDRLVPRGTSVERIAEFGDLLNNVIWRWDSTGAVSIERSRSGYAEADRPPGAAMGSNGMALDRVGRLTVCEPGNRRVTRTEPDGAITVLAER